MEIVFFKSNVNFRGLDFYLFALSSATEDSFVALVNLKAFYNT